MNSELHRLLNFLAESLDLARQTRIATRYRRSLDCKPCARPPLAISFPYPDDEEFTPFPHREIFEDPEKMLFNQLVHAFETSAALNGQVGADLPVCVRANFGTVLVASMFGAPVENRDDNPPWIRHRPGENITLERVIETDATDIGRGWIPRAAARMKAYHELLDEFPGVKKLTRITLPDLQGPLDNLDLICGSEVFMKLATEPDKVEAALDNLATAQIELYDHFQKWATEPQDGYCHQHGVMQKGNILIRNDSSILISPDTYRQHVAPCDERVLQECGGGGIHSCGDCSHVIDEFLKLPSIQSIDLGQPELLDVDAIYEKTSNEQVALIGVTISREEVESGSAFDRFPTGVVLRYRADSFEEACEVGQELSKSTKDTFN